MPHGFIALGSNVSPEYNLEAALQWLARLTRLLAVSTVWKTPPLGRLDQDHYYNCVALIETDLPPWELKFQVLHGIEQNLGRMRTQDKFAPRTIDLDLILYDEMIMDTPELTLPDPDILRRPFLAAGVLELAPELRLPGFNLSISQVVANLSRDKMEPLMDYTRNLRKKIIHESR